MPDGDHDENEVEIITNIQVTKSLTLNPSYIGSGHVIYNWGVVLPKSKI